MFTGNRSYRRELTSTGVISFNNKVLNVALKNLSMTGMLAELQDDQDTLDLQNIFYAVEGSRMINVQLPEMNLSGTAEIIRFDNRESTYIALEFKQLTYKRKVVKKHLTVVAPKFNDTPINRVHVA